ncbi:MAG: hypothetical protein JWO09_1346 [Bacteroidetes bacterium]|nr:hypothetical protein [Bacteroidota bacterium]
MSAIAEFRIIERDKLEGLVAAVEPTKGKVLFWKYTTENYRPYLEKNSRELKGIDSSGYIYVNLICFLEEKLGAALDKNELDAFGDTLTEKLHATVFLLPFSKKAEIIKKIDSAPIDINELIAFNLAFSNHGERELAEQQLEALKVLVDNIKELSAENEVLYFFIG